MFDLEKAISQWRLRMKSAGIDSTRVVDELECHLRDGIEERIKDGIDEERAFEEAVSEIGSAWSIQSEFSKLNEVPRLQRRKLVFGFGIVPAVIFIACDSIESYGAAHSGVEWIFHWAISGLIAAYICSLAFVHAQLSRIDQAQIRIASQCALSVAWLGAGVAIVINVIPRIGLFQSSTLILLSLLLSAIPVLVWTFSCRQLRGGGFPPGLGPLGGGTPILLPPSGPLPIGAPFSPVALESLQAARVSAQEMHHDFVGTEHVLLGLLASPCYSVKNTLKNFGITEERLRMEIERLIPGGVILAATTDPLPLTPRAQKALKLAALEARKLERKWVGIDEMLLGIVCENSGVAAIALKNLGVQLANLRVAIRFAADGQK